MLVRGDRIVAVGTFAEVEAAADRNTRRIDLGGQAVIPGFDDCHCHVLSIGLNLGQIDVSVDAVQTIADIQRAVSGRAEATADGEWLLGRGYDQNMLAERRHPLRQELDEAAGNLPAVLWHTSGHVLIAGTRALELAGIGPDTPDPPGGNIERDERGVPTGLLK
jgi:predicted amidohydrolase YtcJ